MMNADSSVDAMVAYYVLEDPLTKNTLTFNFHPAL